MRRWLLAAVCMCTACVFVSAQDVLSVMTFTDEVKQMADDFYSEAYPDVQVFVEQVPTNEFASQLDKKLAKGKKVPDVVALEDSFVRAYVESGNLLDLTDVYNKIKDKMVDYPCQVGMYNGKCYGLSWQVAPGAVFYRRSLAKKYLGTDNPDDVQKYFASMNDLWNTAEKLKTKSGGKCSLVYSVNDLYKPYMGMRRDPWVVNDSILLIRQWLIM